MVGTGAGYTQFETLTNKFFRGKVDGDCDQECSSGVDQLESEETISMTDEERIMLAGSILAALVLEPIFGYRSAMTFAATVSVVTLLGPVFRRPEGRKRSSSILDLD